MLGSCIKRENRRRRGGIEPLHVPMPQELKSCPSTSPTHPGRMATANQIVILSWCLLCGSVGDGRFRPQCLGGPGAREGQAQNQFANRLLKIKGGLQDGLEVQLFKL